MYYASDFRHLLGLDVHKESVVACIIMTREGLAPETGSEKEKELAWRDPTKITLQQAL